MTGKPGSRSDSAPPDIDDDVYAALKKRQLRVGQILDGALPAYEELLSGLPPRHDDLQSDVMSSIDDWTTRRDGDVHASLTISMEAARRHADADTLHTLSEELELSRYKNQADEALWRRCQVWLSYYGCEGPIDRVVSAAMDAYRWTRVGVDGVYRIGWAVGLKLSRRSGSSEYEAGDAAKIVMRGVSNLDRISQLISPISATCTTPTGLSALLSKQRPADDEMDDTIGSLEALLNDRKDDDDDVSGLVVVPVMPSGTGGQKETRKSWDRLAGKPLPLVGRGDIAGHRRALVARWPHAADVIDVILGDLPATEQVRFRPTMLLGSPGSGKSSLARAICDQIGLPCELTSLAGMSDSSAMGTSAQWSTARESTPLQLIKRSGFASVAMIWDEIEKAGESRHNGNALDALLPMLEMDQAKRFRDLALEVEVDLSAVSHFATANSLEGVPAPVRDRFRVLTMPDPGWQHLHVLTRQIVDRIARERGVDARWFAPLAEDEMDLVKGAWPGGSIRKLTAIVRTIVDGRDRLIGRC